MMVKKHIAFRKLAACLLALAMMAGALSPAAAFAAATPAAPTASATPTAPAAPAASVAALPQYAFSMMDYAIMEGAEGDPKPEPRSFDLRPFAGITGGWGPVWFGFGSTGTYGNVPSTSIENIKDAAKLVVELNRSATFGVSFGTGGSQFNGCNDIIASVPLIDAESTPTVRVYDMSGVWRAVYGAGSAVMQFNFWDNNIADALLSRITAVYLVYADPLPEPELSAAASPGAVSFLRMPEGYGPQAGRKVTVKNTGAAALAGLGAAITAGGAEFEIAGGLPDSLAPGAEAAITVKPKDGLPAGNYAGALTISANGITNIGVSLSFGVYVVRTENFEIPLNWISMGGWGPMGVKVTASGVNAIPLDILMQADQFVIEYSGATWTRDFSFQLRQNEVWGTELTNTTISNRASPIRVSLKPIWDNAKVGGVANLPKLAPLALLFGGHAGAADEAFRERITRLYLTFSPPAPFDMNVSPRNIVFPEKEAPYGEFAPVTVVIENAGTQTLANFKAVLNNDNFVIEKGLDENQLLSGGEASVSVRPANGLAPGAYGGVLRITADGAANADVSLAFKVKREFVPLPPVEQLMTAGNRLVLERDPTQMVQLSGLNLPGNEWAIHPNDENIRRSAREIIANWNSNYVRLGVDRPGWYGVRQYWGGPGVDGNKERRSADYRNEIKEIIKELNNAGIYVIIDLHEYQNPEWETIWSNQYIINYRLPSTMDFWLDVAGDPYYKNNPGVMFGLLNEPIERSGKWPNDTSKAWNIWRNGEGNYIGHQQLVEAIRDAGAKNIIIAAGLDWGYDLRGIVGLADYDYRAETKEEYAERGGDTNWYALIDQGSGADAGKAGYGIMYDAHIYTWKEHWDHYVGECREVFPVMIGENGWDDYSLQQDLNKNLNQGVPPHEIWMPMFFDWINGKGVDTGPYRGYYYGTQYNGSHPEINPGHKYKAYDVPIHWTGWCFHPSAAPRILQNVGNWGSADFPYLPTEYMGRYMLNELHGRDYRTLRTVGAPKAWELPGVNLSTFDGDDNPYYGNIDYGEFPSGVSRLSALTVSAGTLTPEFRSNAYGYSVTLPYENGYIYVNALAKDANAAVDGAGGYSLNVGENVINVTVTAQNGTISVYCITVTREPAIPKAVVKVNGIEVAQIPIEIKNGTAAISLDAQIMAAILAAPGNNIVFDFSGYGAVEMIVDSGVFKDCDKTITFLTASGAADVKTKSLWNNSGKNRLITVKNGKIDYINM